MKTRDFRQLLHSLVPVHADLLEIRRRMGRSSGYWEPPYESVPKAGLWGSGDCAQRYNWLQSQFREQDLAPLSANHSRILGLQPVDLLQHVDVSPRQRRTLTIELVRHAPDEPRLCASLARDGQTGWVAVWWLGTQRPEQEGCVTPMCQFKSSHAVDVALHHVETVEDGIDRSFYQLLVACEYSPWTRPLVNLTSRHWVKVYRLSAS